MDPDNPDNYYAYNNKGSIYLDQGKHQDAIKEYDQAIRSYLKNGQSAKNLRFSFANLAVLPSLGVFETSSRINPVFAPAFKNRGQARYFQKEKDIEGALKDFDEAIRLDPLLAEAYMYKSDLLYDRKNYTEAIANYTKTITLKPSLVRAYVQRGKARYYTQGDLAGAMRDYDEAIRLDANNAMAYNNRGWGYLIQGETDKALKDFNKALRLDNKLEIAYSNRGHLYREKGNLKASIRDLTKAIKLNKSGILHYYRRAMSYQERGGFKKALKDFQKYLELGGGLSIVSDAKIKRMIKKLMKQLETEAV